MVGEVLWIIDYRILSSSSQPTMLTKMQVIKSTEMLMDLWRFSIAKLPEIQAYRTPVGYLEAISNDS